MALFGKKSTAKETDEALAKDAFLELIVKHPGELLRQKTAYKKDVDLLLKAIRKNAEVYRFVSNSLKKNRDFNEKAIIANADVLEQMGTEKGSIADKYVAQYYLSLNPKVKDYVSATVLNEIKNKTTIKPFNAVKKAKSAVAVMAEAKPDNRTNQQKFDDLVKDFVLPSNVSEAFNEIVEKFSEENSDAFVSAVKQVCKDSQEGKIQLTEKAKANLNKTVEELKTLINSKDVDINAKDDEGHSAIYNILNNSENPLSWYFLARTNKIVVDDGIISEIETIKDDANKYILSSIMNYKVQKEKEEEAAKLEQQKKAEDEQNRLNNELAKAAKSGDVEAVKKAIDNGAQATSVSGWAFLSWLSAQEDERYKEIYKIITVPAEAEDLEHSGM